MATNGSEMTKVRKVLDYVPSRVLSTWKGRLYFDALNRRLNREVLVERPMLVARAPDEAVMVVPEEEWHAAVAAREKQMAQENELEQTRTELEGLRQREGDMAREVDNLRLQLQRLEVERDEKRKHALQLVGVRRPVTVAQVAPDEPLPATGAPASEGAPAPAPGGPVPTAQELQAQGWEVLPDDMVVEPSFEPVPVAEQVSETDLKATDDAIARVESEIQRIEAELASLADKEKELESKGAQGPYRYKDFTLYRRTVGEAGQERDFYFFSKVAPQEGQEAPLPAGYEVAVNAKSGLPYLRKGGEATVTKRAATRTRRSAKRSR